MVFLNREICRCVALLAAVLLFDCPYTHAKNCVMVDQCKCTFDDNSGTVDMTSIGGTGGPLVKDIFAQDNYAYSFNPCYPFTEGTCVNAASCQIDMTNMVYYNIGDASNVAFSYDGTNVIATYTADDGARQSKVTLVCDQNTSPAAVQVQGETSTAVYEFTITGKEVCATGGGDSPVGPSVDVTVSVSISVGAILTITFFSILVVYFVAGIVFQAAVRHNRGKEMIPNRELWTSIPGLIKDGFSFTVGFVKTKAGYKAI